MPMESLLPNKRILHPGVGDLPKFADGAKAIFHYRVHKPLMDNVGDERGPDSVQTIDDSRLPWPRGYGQPMELIFGKQFKLPIWETCLRSMRVREAAEFLIDVRDALEFPFVSKQLRDIAKRRHHDHKDDDECKSGHTCMGMVAHTGLGYPELDDCMRKPTPLYFTFELLQALEPGEYEKESWAMTPEQKLESIPHLKESGNNFFRSGDLEEAEKCYTQALSRLDALCTREKPGVPEWLELDRQKIPFYLNISQIKLQQREYYLSIEAASEALSRDPTNSKALYRRGKANVGAWNFPAARKDFENLQKLDASCSSMAEKELQNIEKLEKQSKSDEAARFRNIFN